MSDYRLSIITPDGNIFDDKVESLTAPGRTGYLGVLKGHAPMVAQLKEGLLRLKSAGFEIYYTITAGVLEVEPTGEVIILADSAVKADPQDTIKL